MEKKRYESPLFTALLFVIIGLGLLTSALDPTGLAAAHGNAIAFDSLSDLNLVLVMVGILMALAGLTIRLAAIATLRRNFSGRLRIRDDHALVKSGLYKWVRHPAYLGAILIFLGIPVMLSSILGFLTMLLLIPYLLHRIKLEERMLIERFGDEYEDYIKHSKKLIPLVY